MMKKINELLKKYDLKATRYTKNGKTTIVDTNTGRFVVKERNTDDEIFKYLRARSFNYYPERLLDEDYEITEYVEETSMPNEQKMLDMVTLVALLHNKTTYYKEVDFDDYKEIYEDINNNIEYLNSYYLDVITLIETHVFMSPSEYLLARNISKIFGALNYCREEIKKWYKLVEDKTKQRRVVLHNNLDLSHFIRNEKSYLINWSKSKIGIPIFDLYILYRRHGLDFDFSDLLKHYEHSYPLLEDERKLLFILIALPNKIELHGSEYNITQKISHEFDVIYKTEKLISPYYSKQNERQPQPQQE